MTRRSGGLRPALLAALGYLVMLIAVVWSLAAAREWALANLATRTSIDNWQTWREDVRRQQAAPGPVARRVPKSAEPPGLVLMRDYFPVCLVGAILFTTLLYWVLAWLLRGMLKSTTTLTRPKA
jgi:hypothetical protein